MSGAIDLSPLWSVLRVHGADATAFLHAQLTTDVKDLGPGEAQLSAYLSPRGRVLAQLLLVPCGTDWCVLLHPSLAPQILTRLRMFVLRAQVTLEPDEAVTVLGRWDGEAPPVEANPLPLRETTPPSVSWPGGRVLEIVAREPDRAPAPQPVQDDHGIERWLAEDLRHGIPHVTAATSDRHVAQTLGLESLGAISYQKGCYPGQEIVARAHYLGRVKRQLTILEGNRQPAPGTSLRRGDRSAGEVLMAAGAGAASIVLAVLSPAAETAGADGDATTELRDDDDGSYRPLEPAGNANISHKPTTSA